MIGIGVEDNRQLVCLIEVLYGDKWYSYLSNDLDAERLPSANLVALYWQLWRVEDAYSIVKRLLGLAYFWSGLKMPSSCESGPPGCSMLF